jgi:CRISPR-associated endonuclease/helicase Cas3
MFKPPSKDVIHNALSLTECLAKTYGEKGNKQKGRNVLNHCQIVGEVARELITRMPELLKNDLFPHGSELIAACHDIGKVSPTFQKKIHDALKELIPELKNINPDLEKTWGGHAGVSFAAAEELEVGKFIPEILGQHHGYSPNVQNLATDAVFGGKAWQQRREELIAELKRLLDCKFPKVKSPEHARILAGLTTVSDWIGSSSLFDNPADDWKPFISQALDNAGFVKPQIKPDLTFFDIFNFPPRDYQTAFFQNTNQAGVYILEAPMGLGKTEAALYAAYQLLSINNATGIYFALPTQLTSDKIHERVNQFLEKILDENSPHQKALLAHGNAWLKQTELGEEGNPNASWFDDKKRKILAPFAVGTIDQALMAVMNVKHGFVRTFGLAGKVVILDEVHSYDAYTGTILDELVKALRDLHCTVIILSATLTYERRTQLLTHPHGRGEVRFPCSNHEPFGETPPRAWGSQHYPLISSQPHGAEFQELTVEPLKNKNVEIHCCQNDDDAIEETLKRAEDGQQILWIENTVAEAQAIFTLLSSVDVPIECGLLHSRFLKTDRESNENYWVELYGKDNAVVRKAKGRILVGTQVLEQSLDIDADFLVSRFAPTDMLLQRLGRLWRHENQRPDSAKREAWFLTPDLNAAIENCDLFGNTAKVYAPYILCRSLEVWHKLKCVILPSQIRDLIEATYVERIEQGEMQRYKSKLEEQRAKLKQLALFGLSKAGTTLPESASTRYSEQDSVQVLLLRDYQTGNDATEITFLNGEKIDLPRGVKANDKKLWRELAAALLKNVVHVAIYNAPLAVSIKELAWLKEFVYLGNRNDTDSLLRVAIVHESGEVRGLSGGSALENCQISYDKRLGYRAEK